MKPEKRIIEEDAERRRALSIKLLEISMSAQAASTPSAANPRCHKHPLSSSHDWNHCDLKANMKVPSG
jgi:transposase InsO family protein